ncbi:MAG: hypothetical protein ABI808_04790 [Pseudonocardiales bacterium]
MTAAALGVTAYSRLLGIKLAACTDVPVDDATTPSPSTPPDVVAAQNRSLRNGPSGPWRERWP